jgi:hypothetical protein
MSEYCQRVFTCRGRVVGPFLRLPGHSGLEGGSREGVSAMACLGAGKRSVPTRRERLKRIGIGAAVRTSQDS